MAGVLYSELLREWLSLHSLEVSPSTIYNYEKTATKLAQAFRDKRVDEVTTKHLQDFAIHLFNVGRSENTIINYSKVVSMSFRFAVQKGYIASSPYTGVILPKKEKKDIVPFSEEEVEKLLAVPMKEWLRDAIIIAYKTGMRKGEIFSLQKEDIDFQNKFLMVRHTQAMTSRGVIIKHPKTKTSRRRIDLDPLTLEVLKRRANASVSESIFSWQDGRMIIPWSIADTMKRKCKLAGIQPHRFHDLRHGHATYLLINGVHPKIVQERLGHYKVTITLDTYSYLVPGMQRAVVDITARLHF